MSDEELTIDIGEPYHAMLSELRERQASDLDTEIENIVEEAIHNGYQQMESDE